MFEKKQLLGTRMSEVPVPGNNLYLINMNHIIVNDIFCFLFNSLVSNEPLGLDVMELVLSL